MSNQLENEMQLTVSHEDTHRLAESETREQEVVALNNEELEVVSGGVVGPLKLSTKAAAAKAAVAGAAAALAAGVAVKGAVKVVKHMVKR